MLGERPLTRIGKRIMCATCPESRGAAPKKREALIPLEERPGLLCSPVILREENPQAGKSIKDTK